MTPLTRAALHDRLRQMLGDPAALRYAADLLDHALRLALGELSAALPNLSSGSLILPRSGRQQALSALGDVRAVLRLCYPYTPAADDLCAALPVYETYTVSGSPFVYVGGGRVPRAGEGMFVEYTCGHTLAGLDGASATTLPDALEAALLVGAAGYAAVSRASQVSEAQGSRAGDMNQLFDWGSRMLARFAQMVDEVRRVGSFPPHPSSGWRLDGWDGS